MALHASSRRFLWAALLLSGMILTFSLVRMPSHFFRHNLDKLGHLVLFALLGVLYHGVASRGFRVVTPWRMGLGFGAIALFGGLDELSQIYIPYRSADWKDWAMDVLGGFVATLIAALWAWRKAQRT